MVAASMRTGAAHGLVIGMLATAAACAPGSSYDDLAGGTVDDATLAPPRPVFPVSVSMLATLRPRLRWAPIDGGTGAIVEMCRTRDCATIAHTYEAPGRELVVPEDLEAGLWFWRLRSIAGGKRGTRPGPTWELLLRGPGATGSRDVPSGALSDLDGDGRPDLSTVGNGARGTTLVVFFGADAGFSLQQVRVGPLDDQESPALSDPARPQALAGGVDMQGSGFAVLLDSTFAYPAANRGGPQTLIDGNDYFDLYPALGVVPPEDAKTPVAYDLLTDFDGDGYGDALVVDVRGARVQLGRPRFAGPIVPILDAAKKGPTVAADLDADGFADAVVPTELDTPALVVSGNPLATSEKTTSLRVPTTNARALALATGDLDGNGVADVALSAVAADGGTQLCVFRGDPARVVLDAVCAPPPPGATAFDDQLTAGDLEGDGRDDLVASVRTATGRALVSVKLDGTNLVFGPVFGDGTGLRLTTVWPGRPGRARWVASADAGDRLDVYEGLDRRQELPRPPDLLAAGYGRALR